MSMLQPQTLKALQKFFIPLVGYRRELLFANACCRYSRSWPLHMACWRHRLPRANRGMNECSWNQFLETIQPPASFFRVAIGARCAVHGLAVDKDSVVPLTSSATTSAQAAAIGVVKLSKSQRQLLQTLLAD